MKVIYLTYRQSRIFRVFCIVLSLVVEVINLMLTPFTWVKTKAHLALFTVFATSCCYLYFFSNESVILKTTNYFLGVIIAVAFIKLLRKKLEKLRLWVLPYTRVLPPNVYHFEGAEKSV